MGSDDEALIFDRRHLSADSSAERSTEYNTTSGWIPGHTRGETKKRESGLTAIEALLGLKVHYQYEVLQKVRHWNAPNNSQ